MGAGVEIALHFEEDEPRGFCTVCKEPITGKAFTPMTQIMEPANATPVDAKLCETCYNNIFKAE